MFSNNDLTQIKERDSQLGVVEKQIENFRKGFPFLRLIKTATASDGIKILSANEVERFSSLYDSESQQKDIVKFVPASGAASRMFKELYAFIDDYKDTEEAYREFTEGKKFNAVYQFFKRIQDFAFYNTLKKEYEKGGRSLEEDLLKRKYKDILTTLLDEPGLGYGNLPKGLLEFHVYENNSRTPVEEHIVEGALYSVGKGNTVAIHFTVSPEHRSRFEQKVHAVKDFYEKLYHVKLNVSFSEQKPQTDTIAVDLNNEPFREEDGTLLFRPGGHGALIENLNDIEADIIFIKNIDNVVPDRIKGTTVTFKKALAGMILETQRKIFEALRKLDNPATEEDELDSIFDFISQELCIKDIPEFHFKEEKITFLRSKLNRPLRVCGMVKNEGEPGGGPFFAKNSDGTTSLQIVETSQVDVHDREQKRLLESSTHFNPVDLVIAVKNYRGSKFDLTKFVDPDTGFISKKSKNGKDLKAQELPGLWNGAMSDWNTLFVEVPVITFNPVKTVNDLLRPNHQL